MTPADDQTGQSSDGCIPACMIYYFANVPGNNGNGQKVGLTLSTARMQAVHDYVVF